jgi:hypothetical protein
MRRSKYHQIHMSKASARSKQDPRTARFSDLLALKCGNILDHLKNSPAGQYVIHLFLAIGPDRYLSWTMQGDVEPPIDHVKNADKRKHAAVGFRKFR